VTEPHRLRLHRLAFFGGLVLALALAGCGVKGPLEPPPSVNLAASESNLTSKEKKETQPQTTGLSSETSRVQTVAEPSIMPPKTPDEWKKDKDRQSRSSRKMGQPATPADSFFLDWLL
jgi:predicted small lipoprotein YifL